MFCPLAIVRSRVMQPRDWEGLGPPIDWKVTCFLRQTFGTFRVHCGRSLVLPPSDRNVPGYAGRSRVEPPSDREVPVACA
ncbi:hypothetical protein DPMN_115002 [Dreissena polymorpha]|uniref:Uncharacterized protein n=1 Tax=Dreissena polymorpha TaxID=45954 RepID=A0A9D4KKY0_DREPO|nr:hypothetical protein DPMN_115002 [Dreissena polymorpha]